MCKNVGCTTIQYSRKRLTLCEHHHHDKVHFSLCAVKSRLKMLAKIPSIHANQHFYRPVGRKFYKKVYTNSYIFYVVSWWK